MVSPNVLYRYRYTRHVLPTPGWPAVSNARRRRARWWACQHARGDGKMGWRAQRCPVPLAGVALARTEEHQLQIDHLHGKVRPALPPGLGWAGWQGCRALGWADGKTWILGGGRGRDAGLPTVQATRRVGQCKVVAQTAH
eukprot:scaffold18424_cov119-Isochrysis_galbana.AAC.3